jgi:predicted MFS family arabinose efflux permease
MQATGGAIIADVFSPQIRGKAYGYNSLGFTSGAMLGIVFGGIITTFIGWQYIFFINIPIGVVAGVMGFKYLKDTNKSRSKLNLPGMGLLATALVLLALGLVNLASQGMSTVVIVLAIVGSR